MESELKYSCNVLGTKWFSILVISVSVFIVVERSERDLREKFRQLAEKSGLTNATHTLINDYSGRKLDGEFNFDAESFKAFIRSEWRPLKFKNSFHVLNKFCVFIFSTRILIQTK